MSMIDRWAPWYKSGHRASYGPDDSYNLAAKWLDGLDVEDWGCGYGQFKAFHKNGAYKGVDGTAGFCDCVADLGAYRSETPGLMMRHILEHNTDWRTVLENAAASFTKRMALIVFTPDGHGEQLGFTPELGVPDLALPHGEIAAAFSGTVRKVFLPTATGYTGETVWLAER